MKGIKKSWTILFWSIINHNGKKMFRYYISCAVCVCVRVCMSFCVYKLIDVPILYETTNEIHCCIITKIMKMIFKKNLYILSILVLNFVNNIQEFKVEWSSPKPGSTTHWKNTGGIPLHIIWKCRHLEIL